MAACHGGRAFLQLISEILLFGHANLQIFGEMVVQVARFGQVFLGNKETRLELSVRVRVQENGWFLDLPGIVVSGSLNLFHRFLDPGARNLKRLCHLFFFLFAIL